MKKESNIHLDPIFKLDFFKWTILANQLIIFVFLVLLRFLCFSVNLCLLIDRYKSEEKKSLKMCIARFAWAVNRKTELKFYQKKEGRHWSNAEESSQITVVSKLVSSSRCHRSSVQRFLLVVRLFCTQRGEQHTFDTFGVHSTDSIPSFIRYKQKFCRE